MFPWFQHQPQNAEMQKMMTWFQKTKATPSELGTFGWVDADQFVTGLKMAGPSFTQQKVIDSLNTLTVVRDNGMIPPIDWTKQHAGSAHASRSAASSIAPAT